MKYYRSLEHVGINEDFNQGYRSRAEFEPWAKIDPLAVARAKLSTMLPEEQIGAIEKSINKQVTDSVRQATDAPFPVAAELYSDVLA